MALSELLLQAQSDVDSIERHHARLPSASAASAASVLREQSTQIPVLGGEVDRLQLKVDAVQPASEASRARRKELTATAASLTEAVHALPARLNEAVTAAADKAKAEGNEHFKAGRYDRALDLYSLAISIDRKSPVYRSNRSACYQAKGMWREAAADAKECIGLDVNFVKGVLHLVKCQLHLGALADAAATLQSAPMGMLASSAELAALAQTVRDEIKAAGNANLKAGQHEQAIGHYTLAISLDGSQPIYYSNRSAAHQARRCWREGASDARQAIRLDKLFLKGHLHLGKCLVQMGQAEEAVRACADGISALQEAGQLSATYASLQELLKQAQQLARQQEQQQQQRQQQQRQQQQRQQQQQEPAGAAASGGGAASAGGGTTTTNGGGSGGSGEASSVADGTGMPSAAGVGGADGREARAAALKEQGNGLYKRGEYAEALRLYSQAVGTCPEAAGVYGNRAACWMMMRKYARVVDDCSEALRRDGGLYSAHAGERSNPRWLVGRLVRAARRASPSHAARLLVCSHARTLCVLLLARATLRGQSCADGRRPRWCTWASWSARRTCCARAWRAAARPPRRVPRSCRT